MHFITIQRLNSALESVIGELHSFGFYDSAVHKIDVHLVSIRGAYGEQCYGTGGNIEIPAVSLERLKDIYRGQYTSLRDVLRHEYAHVVADTHRGLLRSRHFSGAFGAHHTWDFEWEHDPEHHVSEYAATSSAEDFAETFMMYLKYRSRIPGRFNTPPIRAKWKFIHQLGQAISAGIRKW